MQVVAILVQLILQGLAANREGLPLQPLLFQLPTQQLRLLFGLSPALFGITQFTIRVFEGKPRQLQLVLDGHTPLEQLFELHA